MMVIASHSTSILTTLSYIAGGLGLAAAIIATVAAGWALSPGGPVGRAKLAAAVLTFLSPFLAHKAKRADEEEHRGREQRTEEASAEAAPDKNLDA